MDNARSLASRFSGFLLFVMSLLVVGVLVYLTIRSASDENGDNQTTTTQTENGEAAEDDGVSDEASSDTQTSSTNDTSANEVAGSTDQLASTGGSDDLPNTGPESAAATAVALFAVAYAGNAYIDSRRRLKALGKQ